MDKNHKELSSPSGLLDRIIHFCLYNKLVVFLFTVFVIISGIMVAPFDWDIDQLPRNPVPVDAIPDIGENQQIVFTEWMGRSPQDVEDQVGYPLTVAMLGIPGVKTVRSYSLFGFSMIYIIFEEDIEFYWSRSRILEKLSSLPVDSLPQGVKPALGPDATALGQIYWYTLEGRDEDGNPAGGWDLHELRSVQDWYVRYALQSVSGVSEVASIGGFVQEYQIDVDPDAMRAHNVKLDEVFTAVKTSNIDVGARTIEVNRVEYIIRGLGFIESLKDIENSVIKVNDNVPIFIRNVANVNLGPALRRGVLDKGGAETVGGVVVVRYGENPLATIKDVKNKINQISPGLPEKIVIDYGKVNKDDVISFAESKGFQAYSGTELNQEEWIKWAKNNPKEKRPAWLTLSKIHIIPFYDRSGLINETLGTLNTALTEEILVTLIVIIIMLMHFRSSLIIAGTLPLAVLLCFIAMKLFHVDANIVALSGIAIAIGTIVDMGVIVCENIIKHLNAANSEDNTIKIVFQATREVGGAVLTAVMTTIVSFLPVFTMIGAEGKLFRPLAFTKTFALLASVVIALTIVPALAHTLFTFRISSKKVRQWVLICLLIGGFMIAVLYSAWIGALISIFSLYHLLSKFFNETMNRWIFRVVNVVAALMVCIILTRHWLPLGPAYGFMSNAAVVVGPIILLLLCFALFMKFYGRILRWCLRNKILFLSMPSFVVVVGLVAWLGFGKVFMWMPEVSKNSSSFQKIAMRFPGLGKEFMPSLDEGSYLYMPTTMPHASIGEALDILQKQDMAFNAIPEIESAVGKIGRAETPLDPAPISMIETVINYKPEYLIDKDGKRLRFKFDASPNDHFRDEHGKPLSANDGESYYVKGMFVRDSNNNLIPDNNGMPFRHWRPSLNPDINSNRSAWAGIQKPEDIWAEIVKAGKIPGATSAPKLQPIAARIVMLQSGMRAPMGIKVKGPDLETIEKVGLQIERYLKDVPSVEAAAVIADRIVGKPYIEIEIDREAIARYGIPIRKVQDVIEIGIGGRRITTTVEGRERYPVRVRYMRELRDQIETLGRILVPAPSGEQIPLSQLSKMIYTRGPQVIKSEDTFLIGYVLFDMKPGYAEVDVVEECERYLQQKIDTGEFVRPPGVELTFAGNYENQLRAQKTLSLVLPLALFIIFLILYFQFKSIPTTLLVFSGIIVAWAGGFILIWCYGQEWFLNISLFDTSLRDLFQIKPINLSVAVWVGFLALFGIATDDGVVMTTYLNQGFFNKQFGSIDEIRTAVCDGALRRVQPCLITTATTLLALLPVLTSTGRGSDIMVPMAIPSFGGMLIALMTMFVVPVLYCLMKEVSFQFKES